MVAIGCSADSQRHENGEQGPSYANTVELRNTQFGLANLEVEAGEPVTWVWNDGTIEHNVVADDFESDIKDDGSFTHTFEDPGKHGYVCTFHRGMEGDDCRDGGQSA